MDGGRIVGINGFSGMSGITSVTPFDRVVGVKAGSTLAYYPFVGARYLENLAILPGMEGSSSWENLRNGPWMVTTNGAKNQFGILCAKSGGDMYFRDYFFAGFQFTPSPIDWSEMPVGTYSNCIPFFTLGGGGDYEFEAAAIKSQIINLEPENIDEPDYDKFTMPAFAKNGNLVVLSFDVVNFSPEYLAEDDFFGYFPNVYAFSYCNTWEVRSLKTGEEEDGVELYLPPKLMINVRIYSIDITNQLMFIPRALRIRVFNENTNTFMSGVAVSVTAKDGSESFTAETAYNSNYGDTAAVFTLGKKEYVYAATLPEEYKPVSGEITIGYGKALVDESDTGLPTIIRNILAQLKESE
jgi:hypothetical protein